LLTATQSELALNMIRQLRLLDPSVSAEVGTPERKIIDTVAEQLATAQIDLTQLNSAFDLESKFGSDLDEFLALFGFARQTGSFATGYVTLSRTTVSSITIPIAVGTQVSAASVATSGGGSVTLNFATTAFGELAPGELEKTIPIRCTTTGSIGNVAANIINGFGASPILGITGVANPIATTGGTDPETDSALKVRFKNTVFRNLAGTEDQFLALAISTAFTSKANAVGPISRYQEYIQVPDVDDATADPDSGVAGNGAAGEWTSALSTIPYSKHVYETLPYYLTTGELTNIETSFFRREVDFRINTTIAARDKGDTYRGRIVGGGFNVNEGGYTTFQPNLTFFNVYQGTNEEVHAIRPGDVLLFEHSYMSNASRNNYERQLLNCVDVYINGQNPIQADAITVKPTGTFATNNAFSSEAASRFFVENFRRIGEPERRPVVGNFFMGLFWTPVLEVPSSITTSQATYYEGIHYWAIEDVSEIGRSVRARTGIEWNSTVRGQSSADGNAEQYSGFKITENPAESLEVTGYIYDRNIVDLQASLEANKQITSDVLAHQSEVRHLKFDLTVMYSPGFSRTSVNSAIRSAIETYLNGLYFGTTIQLSDILQAVHNVAGVDNVRWSRDVLEADGKNEDSVGNPRYRVVETDTRGNPLTNFLIDRKNYGFTPTAWSSTKTYAIGEYVVVSGTVYKAILGSLNATPPNATYWVVSTNAVETQTGYFTGAVSGGYFELYYELSGLKVEYGASAATIKSALEAKSIPINSVTGNGTPTSPFIFTFSSTGYRPPLTAQNNHLTGSTKISSTTVYNSDFFLQDNELPMLPGEALATDTLPGLILRKRAQNTWSAL
jgi:uncharacterized phage protein gp47/JayE